ncbi:hydroxymethylbilane synthase [Methanobacterium alcaliphilum]|uniref:hydroxymethylbilane synthase n=1 Tax=Methanobacterium alcaliphilum TaxID=392018 RepID=UPI00200B1F79|nr:hydroxymethylbilane synthase [Methanobacterium alcaliphilum]MCK9150936.1 hydroxymethylbilane synthase [Methanobacterium alcaliphilum]
MIVGTRGSKLATVQTKYIISELSKVTDEKVDIEIIKTTGDKITDSQLYNIDSKGLFTKELDRAVLDEDVDFAVHSLKDVPTELDEDLTIAAVPIRESPHEALVSKKSWMELSQGATMGTSSLRREAFCNYHQKNFKLEPIRGNIETRIRKVMEGQCDATLMAEAGLKRLGLTKYIKEIFSLDYLTPPAGQGALAIITRKDSVKKTIIKKLNHYVSAQEVLAEKKVLEELGVGCQWPLGAIARTKGDQLDLNAILLTKEGKILSKVNLTGSIKEAEKLGINAANHMEDYI